MAISASKRLAVFNRFLGRCGYCGARMLFPQATVDHIHPRYLEDTYAGGHIDEERNLMPCCRRCNKWKSTLTLEKFRAEIEAQLERLMRDSAQFRLAIDFGLVRPTRAVARVQFYFERHAPDFKRKRVTIIHDDEEEV